MDRLRKRLEEFRLKVRQFVNRNWHNDPEGDKFRSLDWIYILGGVRFKSTQRWQRICWNTFCVVIVCSVAILVLNVVDAITGDFDLVKVTWHTVAASIGILSFVKGAVLNQKFVSIQAARDFINSNPFGSGDTRNDSAYREKFFQRLQLIYLVIVALILIDQIIVLLPYFDIDELLGTPRILHRLGPHLAGGIHFLFVATIVPIWFNRHYSGPGTTCYLLHGFNTEYNIFVHGFENILDNVYSDVEKNLTDNAKAAPEWKRFQRDELFWKFLKQRVNDQVKLHVQLVENIQLLEPVVKILFAIIYYHAMVLFSPLIYIVLFRGFSVTSLFLASGVAINLLECYACCSIIDSHQDINDTLELKIMHLMTKIPHSRVHHKKYAEIRTTLFIVKTFVRNNAPFSCGGVFPINVEAFTGLLNIGYTVVTFLRDLGKKM